MLTGDFIYLLFFNRGYMPLVKSFVCNLRAVNPRILQQTVFVATDAGSKRKLHSFDPDLHVYVHDFRITKSVKFGTFDYYMVTLKRLEVQNLLIQSGLSVMVIEADAVWFADNITEIMQEKLLNADIISADDLSDQDESKKLISAGFLLCKSTPQVRALFGKYYVKYENALSKYAGAEGEIELPGEQWFMTDMLHASNITLKWLDSCRFAPGRWYLEEQYRHRCLQRPLVLQNNYIKGNSNKIKRAKAWGHWFLTFYGTCMK